MTTGGIEITGEEHDTELAGHVLGKLYDLVGKGFILEPADVKRAVEVLSNDENASLVEEFLDTVLGGDRGRSVAPRSRNQKAYADAMRASDLVFAIGPAGTGKTYLAMAMAVATLLSGKVNRIILTRPAVEAGEKLGYLPGDLAEKINPYLRPLYDALYDMVGPERAAEYMERGTVEVAPLAFMRGRTLNDSFVILDEAQNTTPEQMKMVLTRLGFSSQAVITGDVTQIDLAAGQVSGLVDARRVLEGTEGIEFVYFDQDDVVRHPLVREIITAYEASAAGTATTSADDDA
ncbi:MAG: PhoH family protein [Deltaproteobacteria bacterium]|jgi:phosphate starvation-inducible PhoH-like protein|nr:PhoH family protein [Deltaproteobacteria bacterium]